MTKAFIILIENMSKQQEEAFARYCDNNNYLYWHYIKNSWILIPEKNNINKVQLRDYLMEETKKSKILIIETPLNTMSWAGVSPKKISKDYFGWLKENRFL